MCLFAIQLNLRAFHGSFFVGRTRKWETTNANGYILQIHMDLLFVCKSVIRSWLSHICMRSNSLEIRPHNVNIHVVMSLDNRKKSRNWYHSHTELKTLCIQMAKASTKIQIQTEFASFICCNEFIFEMQNAVRLTYYVNILNFLGPSIKSKNFPYIYTCTAKMYRASEYKYILHT